MRLKKSAAKLLDRERVCRVATADAAGTPHVVPVCHVLRDGKSYFAVWHFFDHEGVTFKKKPARRRAGSAGRDEEARALAAVAEEA